MRVYSHLLMGYPILCIECVGIIAFLHAFQGNLDLINIEFLFFHSEIIFLGTYIGQLFHS